MRPSIRWWWSAPGRSACRSRSIWRSAARRVVLLDDADRIGEGSRAICFSKRSLEYWDRLGVAGRMVDKGVVWSVGKIFHGASQLYQFNLLPEQGHKMPAFINLQQFYAEAYLVERAAQLPEIDLRWRNKVSALEQRNDHVVLTIETPDGPYRLAARYVVCLRRRALVVAAHGRCGFHRAGVRGPVPDRRRQDDGGISDRALVLVRSAVPCRALGAAASPARRYLADRSATQPGRGSGGRKTARERAAADRADAGPRQVRIRLDIAVQVPVPAHGKIHP